MLEKIKLRWKIFAYVLIFAAIVIMIFCIFQILMLDTFYRKTKTNAVESLMESVENNLLNEDETTNKTLMDLAISQETAIYLFSKEGVPLKIYGNGNYLTQFQDERVFRDIYRKSEGSGKGLFYITFEARVAPPVGMSYPAINKKVMQSKDTAIICAKFINYNTNSNCLLILDARLTPVEPAVNTLKQQLFIISGIVVVVAVIMAFIISSSISKPIRNMTTSAKLLAEGRRDIKFTGKGYEEITELNKTLNYAVAELNKTDTLQKELLANISHDLKTPLTLISGYAEMMIDMPDEISEDNLKLIVDEVKRLNILVNDLLNLSRLQAKTESFNMEKFNLTILIDSIVNRQNALHEKEGFNFSFINSSGIDAIINGDESKISQVIYNFINNACSYSGDDKNIIVKQELNDKDLIISVIDHGIGIAEDELDVIWNRYYRVDKTHKRSEQGSGLGLSIVKEILEYHGFEYGVESKKGEGSRFYFIVKNID